MRLQCWERQHSDNDLVLIPTPAGKSLGQLMIHLMCVVHQLGGEFPLTVPLLTGGRERPPVWGSRGVGTNLARGGDLLWIPCGCVSYSPPWSMG